MNYSDIKIQKLNELHERVQSTFKAIDEIDLFIHYTASVANKMSSTLITFLINTNTLLSTSED